MREYITAHAIANAIRMKRPFFAGVFLVVEGVSDKHVYGLVLDHECCAAEIAHGRENVLGAVGILNAAGFVGVLGIVDADFSNVAGEALSEENILRTDVHDLECMMLNSPAFDRLLDEFASEERVAAFAVRTPLIAQQLAMNAIPVGCLRLISLRRNLELSFDDLTFSRFLEPQRLQVDLKMLVREVVNRSQKHHLDQTELIETIVDEMHQGYECWQIACGHDIIEILAFAFRKTFAGKSSGNVTVDVLERSLRLAYQSEDLRATKLFQALSHWQQHTGLVFLKPA